MLTTAEKESLKAEILEEVEKSLKGKLIREDTQSTLKPVRDKWFRGDKSTYQSGNGKMHEVMDTITAWASWGLIRKLTCYICGVNYVRHLFRNEDIANEIAEQLCETIYTLKDKYLRRNDLLIK